MSQILSRGIALSHDIAIKRSLRRWRRLKLLTPLWWNLVDGPPVVILQCIFRPIGNGGKRFAQATMDTDKVLRKLFDGAWSCLQGPILYLLLVLIVIALIRHPPGRLP
jgi:hypothetical protein